MLKNYTPEYIKADSLYKKSKKKLIARIDVLTNYELPGMLKELYNDLGNNLNKRIAEERMLGNIRKIIEELLVLPFHLESGCRDSDYLPPEEKLDNAIIEKFLQ
ncbi:MAG: hypothetical protein HQL79_12100 [Magnetococcales bacterium]|nr:hypothetical protein [Magnetococcales bacterium]